MATESGIDKDPLLSKETDISLPGQEVTDILKATDSGKSLAEKIQEELKQNAKPSEEEKKSE